ncbi:FlgN protein [Geosporobacter subterraneus DSM 17957]|uniref:FlgN protein n=1 Tax=Geosporobacter subterraneus DSM 17957 TaxID=1121919 RepID=A0A1M6CNF5_9FIRM|nr:flagellar export chaperone FlgN [Geosporobacter subterraneus]SHI62565.1 FlgN protein [Geosporobacter subterraneus DSM 17957]
MDSKGRIDQLIQISGQKLNALEDLLNITVMQGNSIKTGDLEELSTLIEKKQDLINLINGLDVQFLEHYTHFKKMLHIQSLEEINAREHPTVAVLQQNVGKILVLLKRIEEIDRQNNVHLSKDFEQVKEEMKKIKAEQQSNKIAASYTRKYADVQGVFIDSKDKR